MTEEFFVSVRPVAGDNVPPDLHYRKTPRSDITHVSIDTLLLFTVGAVVIGGLVSYALFFKVFFGFLTIEGVMISPVWTAVPFSTTCSRAVTSP